MPALVVLAVSPGCVYWGGSGVWAVDQAALVPTPQVDLASERPAGPVELIAGATGMPGGVEPVPGSELGAYVPRTHASALVRIPVFTDIHVRGLWELWPDALGVAAAGSNAVPEPAGAIFAVGTGIGFTRYVTHDVWLGTSLDGLVADVPMEVAGACTTCPAGPETFNLRRRRLVPIGRWQGTAGVSLGPFELSVKLAFSNEPHAPATHVLTLPTWREDATLLRRGPLLVVPGASLAWRPLPLLAIILTVYSPVTPTGSGLRYDVLVGLALSIAVPARGGPAAWTRERRPAPESRATVAPVTAAPR